MDIDVCVSVCICVFVCLVGMPGHLAAPLFHEGLQEVADQGPQPGNVAKH